jgi:hypothetical protein
VFSAHVPQSFLGIEEEWWNIVADIEIEEEWYNIVADSRKCRDKRRNALLRKGVAL